MATTTRPVRSLLPAAEVALVVASLATVAGMWRLFVDGSFFWPLAMHAIAAHTVAAVCRRRGLSTALSGVIVGVAAVLVLTWAHLGDTTTLGLPTATTVSEARVRLTDAWRLFDEVRAPAPVLPGFLLSAGAALWAGAFLADVAAFRLWTAFEALIPSGTVFVFGSMFAADRARTGAAALWLTAALAFVLVHRTVRQHGSPSWLGSDPRSGTGALLRTGVGLLVAAVATGWALGPRLPGAGSAAIVELRDLDDGGGGSRQTISPLVEIRGRLVEQSQQEMFSVRSNTRAYWRLTALDEFDGEIWRSGGEYSDADGELDDTGDPPPGAVATRQTFSIRNLAAIWLPAAFEPRAIDPGDINVSWEPETSTLIVDREHRTSDGLTYEVLSSIPIGVTGEQLNVPGPTPDELAGIGNLALPPGFPQRVVAEAQRIVAEAGATTPYTTAMALQQYFQTTGFTYTLEAQPGHSDSAIEDFLFANRAGYCEQFAGTYAAMARAVGLPARVAVGFTPGVPDVVDPSLYHVRGEHAHAWPEVWIPGAGWMAFEPTPGRGAPGAESYTGLLEQQDEAGAGTSATTVPTTVPGGAPTTAGPGEATPSSETGLTDVSEPEPFGSDADDDGTDSWGRVIEWIGWAFLATAVLAIVAGLFGVGIAVYRVLRRWRRRSTAHTADAKVRSAWADTLDAVGVVGVVPRRWETPLEYARRASKAIGDTRPTPLAWVVERADYAAEDIADDEATEALTLADGIRDAVRQQTRLRTRALAAMDPRPPERRGRARGPRPTGPRIQIRSES